MLGEAEQLAALAVDELDAAVGVEHDDELRDDLEVALRAVALLAQAAGRLDRGGHVGDGRDDAAAVGPVGAADRAREDRDPALGPAGRGAAQRRADRRALAQRAPRRVVVLGERLAVVVAQTGTRERRHAARAHVVERDAEDPQRARVPAQRREVGVEHDDALLEAVDDRAREPLGRAQRLPRALLRRRIDDEAAADQRSAALAVADAFPKR